MIPIPGTARTGSAVRVATNCDVRDPGSMETGRVLGVDACKRGWVAIAVEDGITGAYFAEDIQALIRQAEADGPLAVVAVDMPIGLPDRGYRQADVLARAAVGPLWPSVFMTPVRQALLAADHAAASAINRELTGHGISVQAFGLKPKLFQIEQWVQQHSMVRVVEIHPEVCFARLARAPLTARKSSWAGAEHRRTLLADAGIRIAGDIGPAGVHAAVDDVLDAGAAAWTARQVLLGHAQPLPNPPQVFSDGWACAIWS